MGSARKRLRFQKVNGHKFAHRRQREDSRGQRSICGLSLEEATKVGDGTECAACKLGASQLWQ